MLLTFRNERTKSAVLFIHGFAGDAARSWADFQVLLVTDPRVKEWDCFSFGYQSFRTHLHFVAHDFYLSFKSPPLSDYERIAIVAHSTGGLVAQLALLDHEDLAKRVSHVFFFALPSRGMLPAGKVLSALPFVGQLVQTFSEMWMSELESGSPPLADLRNRWDAKFGEGAPFVYYSIAAARDRVVMIGTLTSLRAAHRLIVDEDHVSIIKPTRARRESLDIVITGLNDQSVPTAPRRRADVVVELEAKEKNDNYDVFLYYSPRRPDSDIARDIAQRLQSIGKKPWLIEEQGVGQNWWPKLISHIERIKSVAIFFGNPSAAWRKQLLLKVISEFAQRKKPIIPVFLPNAPPDDSDLPDCLQTVVGVDWSDARREAFDQLVAGIEGKQLAIRKQNRSGSSIPAVSLADDRAPARRGSRRQKLIFAVLGSSAALVAVLVVLSNRSIISIDRSPFEITSTYVGPPPYSSPVAVVFVHGIFGTRDATWINHDASFPALLEGDPEFHKKVDVFVFEYFTPKFGNANSIVGLSDQFRGRLDDNRVFEDHQRVVFVSHSMGGLIVRQFLLTKRERLSKVPMLYFYATPTNGSELTTAAREISSNPQLRGMLPLEGNDLLQSIQSGWLGWDAVKSIPSYCAYETLPTLGVMVVSMASATALCNEDLDPITANHIDIVKPRDRRDPRYSRLAHALQSVLPSHFAATHALP